MLSKQEQYKYTLFILLIVFTYFWNIWLNDIWNPNEGYYAEAVREMFESGNFIDIYYNYEHRFNKPPLTYWLIASSCFLFGINEFAIRLPIVLLGLGSLFLTFKIAQLLFNNLRVSLYSAFIMAFSLQFVANTRYASPEVPLTFFFLLTLYLFLKWYKTNQAKFLYLSYIALGLTVLTKGFPYIIVIGGIITVFLFIEANFKIKEWWNKFLKLKVWIGLPIVIVIGFWWYVYSYLKYGDLFWNVYYKETLGRAFGNKHKLLTFKSLTYYFNVILWGFLPYSLTAYFVVINYIKQIKRFAFLFSWIFVMLFIFTLSKGKLPTYIIQMFPALSILIAYAIVNLKLEGWKKYVYNFTFLFQTIIFTVFTFLLVYFMHLDYLYYIFAVFPILYLIRYKDIKLTPFVSALTLFLVFVISGLVKIEKYRPYDEIGKAVKESFVSKNVPFFLEGKILFNLPFYIERKAYMEVPVSKVLLVKSEKLVLVRDRYLNLFNNYEVLWKGKIYKGHSEAKFAKFLKAIIKAENGDLSEFEDYTLIHVLR